MTRVPAGMGRGCNGGARNDVAARAPPRQAPG